MSNLNQFTKTTKGRNKCSIYTRISPLRASERNDSMKRQKKLCEDYARENGLQVTGCFPS